jgi:protocatechuate 4,5-dioxygenase, alpha chain
MARTQQVYDDIPGTFVFDAERAKEGYHLNMFCMSLMKEENRKAFKADEAKYLDRFRLTPEQREAILKREYNRMLELGGNIYFTAKLGATDGHSFQHIAAVMTGSTQEDYAKMMLAGGRPVEGNRSKSGRDAGAKPAPARPGRKASRRPAAAKPSASSGKSTLRKPASRKPESRKPASRKPASRPRMTKRPPKAGSKRG